MAKEKQKLTRTELMQTISAAEFGRRMARTFAESKSSTAIFFIQQAFADTEDDIGIFWDEFRDMLARLEKDAEK